MFMPELIVNPIEALWSEDRLQQEVWTYLNNTYVVPERCIAYHIPNGGSRNEIEGRKLKAMGVVAGVADIFIGCRGKVLYIELKVGNKTQSKAQIDFQNKAIKQGFKYVVSKNLNATKIFIDKFIRECEQAQ